MEQSSKLGSNEQTIPRDKSNFKQTTLQSYPSQKKAQKPKENQHSNEVTANEELEIDESIKNLSNSENYMGSIKRSRQPAPQNTEELKETEKDRNISTIQNKSDVNQKIISPQGSKSYKKAYILPHKSPKWSLIKPKLEFLASGPVKEVAFYDVLNYFITIHHSKGENQKNNFSLLKTAIASFSNFFDEILPFAAWLALNVDSLFPEEIPLLCQYEQRILFLSKAQSACLLFHMFFCTTLDQKNQILPTPCTLIEWYNSSWGSFNQRDSARLAKLKCFLNYAKQMKNNLPELEKISIERTFLELGMEYGIDYWANSTEPLSEVVINGGSIQEALGSLQIDFANKYLGGGVLTTGCVQEEIMFALAPEHFCSLLLSECLTPQEAAIIKGAQEYSKSTGYGEGFKYDGDFDGQNQPLDKFMRRDIITVAIDALEFRTADMSQFQIESVLREMNKALAGFQGSIQERKEATDVYKAVATGRWGCGAFRGDPQLKFIVQWLACSKARRKMVFYPFGDKSLLAAADVVQMYKKSSIAELFIAIILFIRDVKDRRESRLFEYLLS